MVIISMREESDAYQSFDETLACGRAAGLHEPGSAGEFAELEFVGDLLRVKSYK